MKNNLNTYRHWYLYFKGWYKKTNIIEDLKKIQSNWSGIDERHISKYDVLSVVTSILYPHLSKDKFFKFIDDSLKENTRFVGGSVNSCHIERMIYSAKSILSKVDKDSIDGDLGYPDFSILPKSPHIED